MRVYHFLKRKYGLQAIERRRLKVARLDGLNDPFEFMPFNMRRPVERDAFDAIKAGMNKSTGLLCFSEKHTNPVHWTHYGDTHTGICLAFDMPADRLAKVRYVRQRGNLDAVALRQQSDEVIGAAMIAAMTTKYSHWRYEAEWRAFIDLETCTKDDDLYFEEFGDGMALREVIVGEKSTITRAEVVAAIGDLPGVETFRARLAYQSFSVVKNKMARLWK